MDMVFHRPSRARDLGKKIGMQKIEKKREIGVVKTAIAENRLNRQVNLVIARVPALDSKLIRWEALRGKFQTKTLESAAKENLALAQSYKAEARTAYGWQNLLLNGKYTTVTGKLIQGFWNWRSNVNANKAARQLESESVMRSAMSERVKGILNQEYAKKADLESKFTREMMKNDALAAQYVLYADRAVKQTIKTAEKLKSRTASLVRAYADFVADADTYHGRPGGHFPPANVAGLIERTADNVRRLNERLTRETDIAVQEEIADRINQIQSMVETAYKWSSNPRRSFAEDAVIGRLPSGVELKVNNAVKAVKLLERAERLAH